MTVLVAERGSGEWGGTSRGGARARLTAQERTRTRPLGWPRGWVAGRRRRGWGGASGCGWGCGGRR